MSAPVDASGPWSDGPVPGATPPELSLVVVIGAGACEEDELDVVGLVVLAEDVGCELEDVALDEVSEDDVGAVEPEVSDGPLGVVELVEDVVELVAEVALDEVVADDVVLVGPVVVVDVAEELDVVELVGSVLDVVVLVELVGSVGVVVLELAEVDVVLVGAVDVVVGTVQSGRSPVNG